MENNKVTFTKKEVQKAKEEADKYVVSQVAQDNKLTVIDKANIRSDFLNGYFKALGTDR